ncbi:hypothetical protein EB796_002606 [Bugula neritina]|uniref:Uncharacterized protein n=1 Tax=Bugula neritina TaxID=10212 RepID=A0A7J7KKH2_BUGNE|nr:hypothetical protein EB796_002606 [Bugula neritina]
MVYLLTQKRLRMFGVAYSKMCMRTENFHGTAGYYRQCSEFLISSKPIESPHISIHFFWLDTRWSASN